jgi:hypothetical protein
MTRFVVSLHPIDDGPTFAGAFQSSKRRLPFEREERCQGTRSEENPMMLMIPRRLPTILAGLALGTLLVAGSASAAKSEPPALVATSDSMGSTTVNDALSLRRAEAVRDYLASQGVSAESMRAEGQGSKRPLASNGTGDGRAQNRRIEIVFAPREREIDGH